MLHKPLLTVLLCALLAVSVSAQRFAVGATGGVRLVQFTGSPSDQGYVLGFGIGGAATYTLAPRFALHGEVLFADFGKQLLTQDDYLGQTPSGLDAYVRTRDRQLGKYVEVPVLARYLLPATPDGRVQVHFGVGAATAFRVTCTLRTDTEYYSRDDGQVLLREFSDAECGGGGGGTLLSLLAGFGGWYDFGTGRVFAEARYNFGLSAVAASSDGKLRQITVAAGLAHSF